MFVTLVNPIGVSNSTSIDELTGNAPQEPPPQPPAENQPPEAADDAIAVEERGKGSGNVLNGDGADSDPDGDRLTVTAVNGDPNLVAEEVTLPSGLIVTIAVNGNARADASQLARNLAEGQSISETVPYQVADPAGATAGAALTVTVTGRNDSPEAVDDALAVAEGAQASVNLISGPGRDSDPDGDQLTVVAVANSAGDVGAAVALRSGGVLTIQADGTATYDASALAKNLQAGATLVDRVAYRVTDPSGATANAVLEVTVTGSNEQPLASDDALAVGEGQQLSADLITGKGGANADQDPDGDGLSVAAFNGRADLVGVPVTLGSGAVATLQPNGSLSFNARSLGRDLAAGEQLTERLAYTVDDGQGGRDDASLEVTITGFAAGGGPAGGRGDKVNGTLGPDDLVGLGGNDTIKGFAADDRLEGGGGNDKLDGGEDTDTAVYFGVYSSYLLQFKKGVLKGIRDLDPSGSDDGTDKLKSIEILDFRDRDIDLRQPITELFGSNDKDKLNGTAFADTIDARDGNDTIKGFADNDVILGGSGNDKVDGGDGIDVAIFSGARAGYEIVQKGSKLIVEDLNPNDGDDGRDTLVRVEVLDFNGQRVETASLAAEPHEVAWIG